MRYLRAVNDSRFRALPAVEALVGPDVPGAPPRVLRVEAARLVLSEARAALAADGNGTAPSADELARAAAARAQTLSEPLQARVINATGVVLHTNLGRAPLSEPARRAIAQAASGYLSLEYDVPEGRRSHRALGVEAWLTRLTGAEAAM